jgi:hypothetical protein
MQDALNGDLDATVVGTIQLAGDVATTLSAIPILGTVATFVSNLVQMIFGSAGYHDEGKEEAYKDCQNKLTRLCEDARQGALPSATGSEGVTPSDMFRQCLYNYRSGTPLPMSAASMYILLCGGQTQGFGIPRTAYDSMVSGPLGGRVGIHPETQRLMWKLIKGIMFAAEPPELRGDLTPIGDKGRALFPVLQDIVRNEFLRFERTQNGGWNIGLAQALSDWLVGHYQEWGTAAKEAGVFTVMCDGATPVRRVDLSGVLYESARQWQNQLQEKFWRDGKYFFGGTGKVKMGKGMLGLSMTQAKKLVDAANPKSGQGTIAYLESLSAPKAAAVTAALAAAGYLGYEGYRLVAKRRRHA